MKNKLVIIIVAVICLIIGIIIGKKDSSSKQRIGTTTSLIKEIAKEEEANKTKAIELAKNAFTMAREILDKFELTDEQKKEYTNEAMLREGFARLNEPFRIEGWRAVRIDDGVYMAGFYSRRGKDFEDVVGHLWVEVHIKEGIVREVNHLTYFDEIKKASEKEQSLYERLREKYRDEK